LHLAIVVAYALAGRVDIDLNNEPIGKDKKGKAVYLKDIWPTHKEIALAARKFVKASIFRRCYKMWTEEIKIEHHQDSQI